MIDLVRHLYELSTLRARQRRLGHPLSQAERVRLQGLERLFAPEPLPPGAEPHPHRRRSARCECECAADLHLEARRRPARVRDLGADGLCLSTAAALPVGVRLVLRFVDDELLEIYSFPARVVWACPPVGGEEALVGVELDGAPLMLRRGRRPTGELPLAA